MKKFWNKTNGGRKSGSEKRLQISALIITCAFALLMLYPLVFAISSAMKDNAKIYDIPPKLLPDAANSVSIIIDYSDAAEQGDVLLDNIKKDAVLTMFGISQKLSDESIMEIKVYGVQDGTVIFHSRAHQMKLQMEKDYGIYKGSAIKTEVLLYGDRYIRACDSVGFEYNPEGLSISLPDSTGIQFQENISELLSDKFAVSGKFLSATDCVKNSLNLESFKYYLQMPAYIYPTNERIANLGFMTFVMNSVIVIGFAIICQVFLCSICAFVISRQLSPRTGQIVLLFFLGGMMIPFASIMLPQLIMFRKMGAYNNYWALLLPFLYPYGFYVYLYKKFFDRIPKSYFEAAALDGASTFYLYRKICMPLSKPIISMIALQTFIGNWNDFFWAWLVTENQDLWTLNVALYNISNNRGTKQNALMGLAVVTITPVILLSILFSRQLKQSIMDGGVKG